MKGTKNMLQEELGRELRERFELDQKLLKDKNFKEYFRVCYDNYLWLKGIVDKEGWLYGDKLGVDGENYAWLIVQHCPDLEFQKKCLRLIEKLPLTEKRKGHIAYLTDRILVNEGRKQVYGTQFNFGKPFPIENEESLDERRKQMGLENFAEYKEKIRKR
jgi:hypothetical protein